MRLDVEMVLLETPASPPTLDLHRGTSANLAKLWRHFLTFRQASLPDETLWLH
jgi:hypothetical protein